MSEKTHGFLELLYKQLGRKILSLILKRNGGNLEVAESVLQDTFIAAYKSFNTFNHKSTYFTWLCKIALNKLADYYRHQANKNSKTLIPTISYINQIVDPKINLEEQIALSELKNQVNRSLDLLPTSYRRLLHLRYYQELSSKEICLKLHISPRKLEGKLYRAKKALAKIYEKSTSRN